MGADDSDDETLTGFDFVVLGCKNTSGAVLSDCISFCMDFFLDLTNYKAKQTPG